MKYIIIGKTHDVTDEPSLVWDCMTNGQPGANSESANNIIKTINKAFGTVLTTLPNGLYRFSYLEYSNDTDIETAISHSQNNDEILKEEQFDFNSPSLILVPTELGTQHAAKHPNMRVVPCSEQQLCNVQFIKTLMIEYSKAQTNICTNTETV